MPDHLPLYRKGTNDIVGHLGEPTHIKDLKPGDVVWDERNDREAVFDGWSALNRCYLLYWPSNQQDDYFCAWDLDGTGRPHMWRHVVIYESEDNASTTNGVPNRRPNVRASDPNNDADGA